MKPFKINKYLAIGIGLLIAIVLFIIGKDSGHDHTIGASLAEVAVVSLTDAEKQGFNENEQKVLLAMKKWATQIKDELNKEGITKEKYEELKSLVNGVKAEINTEEGKTLKQQFEEIKKIAEKQGTTLTELGLKVHDNQAGTKSIAKVLEDAKDELKAVYQRGSGYKEFMVQMTSKGDWVAKPFDRTKAAGPHASIDDVGTNGNTASISQSIDAASLLRLGGNAPIISVYRNTPWIFDLCNLINAGFEMPLAMWYEEQAKQGASAEVAEGGSKPITQYAYDLKTATYRKEATLLGFTEEFSLDFARLQSDILGKGRVDLVNRINSAILTRMISAATAYNTSASFGTVANANEFDAIAAMAAQVDNATFGAMANAAVMSTFKKYNIGLLKDDRNNYLNRPSVLDNISFVGNPGQSGDNVMVGDFKQYNILLRGGMIVRVGYNGTDFAENRFSTVLEQFYFDYISSIRAAAIVKGPDFATVKAAITAAP